LLAVLVLAGVLDGTAAAAPRLELRLDGDRLEATVVGAAKSEPVMLRDLTRDRRIPSMQVQSAREHGDAAATDDRFYATFAAELLEGDGKPHELAIEVRGQELARTTLVLPAPPEPSNLRWLVIVGPLAGLLMIGAAIFIGRRVRGGR
jgi:hypothetical protein